MTCPACGTNSPDNFWICPECQELNPPRAVKLGGLIFLPLICLAIGTFGDNFLWSLGFSRMVLYFGWMVPFFPFAGVPFAWLGEGSWVKKTRFSLGYVVFCYLLVVYAVVLFFIIAGQFRH